MRRSKVEPIDEAGIERLFALVRDGIRVAPDYDWPSLQVDANGQPEEHWIGIPSPTSWKRLRKEIASESRVRPRTWRQALYQAERSMLARSVRRGHWALAREALQNYLSARPVFSFRHVKLRLPELWSVALAAPSHSVDPDELELVVEEIEDCVSERKKILGADALPFWAIVGLFGNARDPSVGKIGVKVIDRLKRRTGNVPGIHGVRAVFQDYARDYDGALASLQTELDRVEDDWIREIALTDMMKRVRAHRSA